MLSTQPGARQICLAFLENVLSRETCLAMKSVRPIEFLHFWQVPQASPSYLSLLLVDPFKDPFWTYRFAESNKKQIKEAFIWGNFYDIADDEGVTLISAAPTDSLKPRSTLIFFLQKSSDALVVELREAADSLPRLPFLPTFPYSFLGSCCRPQTNSKPNMSLLADLAA